MDPRSRTRSVALAMLLALIATAIVVLGPASPASAAPGTISGTVTRGTGGPLAGGWVEVTAMDGNVTSGATTNSSGAYNVTVEEGTYCVGFGFSSNDVSLTTYGGATSCRSGTTPVVVTGGGAVTGINAVVHAGTLAGTVRAAGSGTPIVGASVRIKRIGSQADDSAVTTAGGVFTIEDLMPGTYCVRAQAPTFAAPATTGPPTCYPGEVAATVPVDAVSTPITVSLDPSPGASGGISGRVTASGAAVASLEVTARSLDGDNSVSATTAADGRYTIIGLSAGSYCVYSELTDSAVYTAEVYDNADSCAAATPVVVGSTVVGDIDLALDPGGRITGTITGPGGAPIIGNAQIRSFDRGVAPGWSTNVLNGVGGVYLTPMLPAGPYCVSFSGIGAYAPETYDNAAGCALGATPVVVTRGATTTANAELSAGGSIQGRLTVPAGVDPRELAITGWGPADFFGYHYSNTIGDYTIANLTPGRYCIVVRNPARNNTVTTTFGVDASDFCNPNRGSIIVREGEVTRVDLAPPQGGTVSGFVIDAQGAPIADAYVDVADPATGRNLDIELDRVRSDGSYSLRGVPVGTWCVIFRSSSRGVGSLGANGQPGCPSGRIVSVTAGSHTGNVDLAPPAVGSIGGTIRNPSGRALTGYRVDLVPLGAGAAATEEVLFDEPVTLASLTWGIDAAPGTYCVVVWALGGQLGRRAAGDVPDCERSPTRVTVRAREVTTSVDIVLRPATFVALDAPARLMDTRPGQPTIDGAASGEGAVNGGDARVLRVAGRGGIPANATSAVLNVTAVDGAGPGYLTVYPCDQPRPTASNLNYVAGQVVPNAVVTRLAADGTVCVFAQTTVDVAIDTSGHVASSATFSALAAPARLLDTRAGAPTIDGRASGEGAITAGTVRALQVTGRAGVPAGTSGAVLNVTAIGGPAAGFVTVYPCGAARPTASNLNVVPGAIAANTVITKVGDAGTVCIFALQDVDVVVDVSGHVPSADALGFLPAPARLLDTRPDQPTVDGLAAGEGPVADGTVREVVVAGRGGTPATAAAVVLNVTAVDGTGPGFVTVFPCGAPRPTASNLNFVAGQAIPNAVVTRIGAAGKVCLFAQRAVDLVVDTAGSFLA